MYKITEEEQNRVKHYTAASMPDNPSERGMGPNAIKLFFYKFLEPLFKILNEKYDLIEDTQDAYDLRSIIASKYTAPDKYLLNSYVNDIFVVPEGASYKGELKEALVTLSCEGIFYQNQTETGDNEAGFVIDFGENKNIGVIQMHVFSVKENTNVSAYVSDDAVIWHKSDTIQLSRALTSDACLYQFRLGKDARYVKIVQEGADFTSEAYVIKEIEIFEANYEGKYVISQKNGNVIALDMFIASSFIEEVLRYKSMAENWAQGEGVLEGDVADGTASYSAKHWAEKSQALYDDIDSKKGRVDGYAPLEHIEDEEYPKIPSMYINQIDVKEYKKITDEAQLDTIAAQKHDVAILVEPERIANESGELVETGELVITKSWLLYDVSENDTREWIKFGISYATNAGYATYANNAGNARAINGAVIEKMSYESYIEQQNNGTLSAENIYIVEV